MFMSYCMVSIINKGQKLTFGLVSHFKCLATHSDLDLAFVKWWPVFECFVDVVCQML